MEMVPFFVHHEKRKMFHYFVFPYTFWLNYDTFYERNAYSTSSATYIYKSHQRYKVSLLSIKIKYYQCFSVFIIKDIYDEEKIKYNMYQYSSTI